MRLNNGGKYMTERLHILEPETYMWWYGDRMKNVEPSNDGIRLW